MTASEIDGPVPQDNCPAMIRDTVAAVRRFSRFYTKQLGALGEGLLSSPYTLTEVRVMYEIAHGRDVTATDLIEQLRLDPGYLSRILQRFEDLGLLRRQQSAEDKRRSILALTAKGTREFSPLDERQDKAVEQLLSGVTAFRRRQLVRSMRLVEDILAGEPRPASAVRLRQPKPGEFSWIVHRFSRLFWEEYGYDQRFERLVLGIAAEYFQRAGQEGQRCWVAARDGEPVGSILLTKKTQKVGQLRLLYVEPEERGQGIGSRLLKESISFARRAGYRKLVLWTQDEEREARRLYARLGFELVGSSSHSNFTSRQITAESWELLL